MAREISMFAAFHNPEHQMEVFKDLLDAIPKDKHFNLFLYLGMLSTTQKEGYIDVEICEKKSNDNKRVRKE